MILDDDFERNVEAELARTAEWNRETLEAEITRLRQLLSEAEAALDEREIASGLTSNGNLWRFWAEKAKDMATKLSEAEKREAEAKRIAANAEAYGYGHGVEAAATLLDKVADKQKTAWDAHIASGSGNAATSHEAVYRSLASQVRAMLSASPEMLGQAVRDDNELLIAAEIVRRRAAKTIEAEKWVVVDGYGQNYRASEDK